MIKTILLIIFEFMKTGLMAVGGGMACIRFLQDMIAKYAWLTGEEVCAKRMSSALEEEAQERKRR